MFGLPVKPRPLISTNRMRPHPIDPPGVRLDVGHFAPKPGSDYKTRLNVYEQKIKALRNLQSSENVWDKTHENLLQEFLDSTEKKSACKETLKLLNYALEAEEIRLNEKRERLRILLTEEENLYKNEFQNDFLNKVENNIKQRELTLLSIKKERERANEEFVKQKRIQQYIETCDEIRPHLRQALLIDSKQCQLKQIKDKEIQKQESKDLDNIWLEIADRRNKMEDKKQADIKYLENMRNMCADEEMKRQMISIKEDRESKERQKLDAKILDDKNLQELIEQDKRIEEIKLKKRQKLTRDLKQQLLESAICLENRKRDEKNFQTIFDAAIDNEIQAEKSAATADALRLKHETKLYLEYYEKVRKERMEQEAAKQKVVDEFQCKIATDEFNRKQELLAKRLASKMDMIKVRNQQILDKAEHNKNESEKEFQEAVNSRKIYEFNSDLDEDYKRRKHRSALTYGKQLLEQMEYNKMLKQKECEDYRKEDEKIKNEQNACRNMVQEFLLKGTEILPIHPTLRVIKNNSGNMRNKKAPNCDCP